MTPAIQSWPDSAYHPGSRLIRQNEVAVSSTALACPLDECAKAASSMSLGHSLLRCPFASSRCRVWKGIRPDDAASGALLLRRRRGLTKSLASSVARCMCSFGTMPLCMHLRCKRANFSVRRQEQRCRNRCTHFLSTAHLPEGKWHVPMSASHSCSICPVQCPRPSCTGSPKHPRDPGQASDRASSIVGLECRFCCSQSARSECCSTRSQACL